MRLVMVLDCVDADALADFWSTALGYRRDAFGHGSSTVVLQDPQGNEFCVLRPPDGDPRLAEI
ncbi:VOC family protein [Actinoplanes sp. NPDC051411]|uniref:VOC family protein n=1 Tax=Actinoplanes sp. NPDC051411 TaxID=3155522 RepID=UPI00341FF5F0